METNDSYTEKVNNGEYPEDPAVPLDTPFINENGIIQNLVLKPMTSVAVITSKKGTMRANHYHKTDWHYTYVLSGIVEYYERPVSSKEIPSPHTFKAGEMFFTPPMREHTMVFPEETVIITMARNVRNHESHEADLVRVKFMTHDYLRSQKNL
jgi:quercetin dioxygenase-like cupin family protein